MATPSVVKLCRSILFVATLQVTRTSALQCFQCIMDPQLPPERSQIDCAKYKLPDKFLVGNSSSRPEFLQYANAIRYLMTVKNMKRITGPFCVQIMHKEETVRFQMPEAPEAIYLDVDGCLLYGATGQVCFCKEDKCNSGPTATNSGALLTVPKFLLWTLFVAMLATNLKLTTSWQSWSSHF